MKRILIVLLLIGLGTAGYFFYTLKTKPAVPADWNEPAFLYIPTGASFDQVVDSLQALGAAGDEMLFNTLAERMNYGQESLRPGRYQLDPGMSYLSLIRRLRNGQQAPVNLVLTTEREPINVAAKAARYIEADSATIARLLQDEAYLDSIGYTPQTLQSIFIPNTYQVYWTTTPREFVQRMKDEHDRFWSQGDRRSKAQALGMSPEEVYTLASIVEKESLVGSERARIAGVYLNRLELGMRLQADPTVVYANRIFDTGRVLYRDLEIDSPYNTYKYAGLPPGPIAMASIASIDAVLNPEDHDYLFFVALGDGTGRHNFAETNAGHIRNIGIYQRNLRERGLR